METNQTNQMVAWLDEERRKDKALITKLEERTAAQAALIEEQTRRTQSLESQIASLQSSMLTASMFDETILRIRTEFAEEFEQFRTRRTTVDQDLKKMRDMDRDALIKSIDELRQEFVTRVDRAMQPRRSEEERLSRVATELQSYADNLGKGLEEFERSLGFLEEQRRQDNRRISDINGELADVAKRAEARQAKIDLLEDLSRRNERAVTELSSLLSEFKQQQQSWSEQQALAEQQRERTMNDMVRRMDSYGEEMVSFGNQVELWAETHRSMKQHVEDFERLADRVDRRMNELGEVQRLSEERFRQEWEDYMGDDQKRWRQFTLTNEEAWRENAKAMAELQSVLTHAKEQLEHQSEHIRYQSKMQRDLMVALATQMQSLQEQAEDTQSSLPSLT